MMQRIDFSSITDYANALSYLTQEQRAAVVGVGGDASGARSIEVPDDIHAVLMAVDWSSPAVSEEDVRTEAARRLMATYGARDTEHLTRLINDGVREAVRLLRIGEANWTADQTTRAAELEIAEAYVDAMDAASKALRAMQPIPADYADDVHWPDAPGA